MTRSPVSIMAVVLALGCGGRENGTSSTATRGSSSSGASSGSSSSGASSGANASVDASTVTERNPQCPVSVPTAGDPCKPILECEYGTDSHHVCSTVATCASNGSSDFTWFVSPPAAGCGTNAASCPASFTALAAGSPCPGVSSFCEYPEGLCRCIPCGDDAGISSMWGCGPWAPGGVDCPAQRPLSGDACSVPNQECSYGGSCGVDVGPDMVCRDGYWQATGGVGSCAIPRCGAPGMDASDSGGDGSDVNNDDAETGPASAVRTVPTNHRVDDSQCRTPYPTASCSATANNSRCVSDTDCTDGGASGHCQPFGYPGACVCDYDTCQSDSDCGTGKLCVCHGSAHLFGSGNTCMPGHCRVDADCGPQGFCSPSPSTDSYSCGAITGYYCHTTQDECGNDSDCGGAFCQWSLVTSGRVLVARWECKAASLCAVGATP